MKMQPLYVRLRVKLAFPNIKTIRVIHSKNIKISNFIKLYRKFRFADK